MTENLANVSNHSLVKHLKQLVEQERELQLEILRYLKEIYERRLYLEKGYPSLFAFMTEELAYSEGAAGRRIRAMKLMGEVPEVEAKLESGNLSITVASQIQSFVQNQDKKRKTEQTTPLTSAQKLDLVNQLVGTSSRACEEKLAQISPESAIPREKTRILTQDKAQIQFVADKTLLEKLEKLKNLTSHSNPEGKYGILFEKLAEIALDRLDPERRAKRRLERKAKKLHQPHHPNQPKPRPGKSLIQSGGNRPVRSQWPAIVGKALVRNEQKNPDLAPRTSALKLENKTADVPNQTATRKCVNKTLEQSNRTSAQKLENKIGKQLNQTLVGNSENKTGKQLDYTSAKKFANNTAKQAKSTSAQKLKQGKASSEQGPLSRTGRKARYIPQKLKDYIWRRDQGECQFKNRKSGKTCGSKRQLQLDHVYPYSWGGEHSSENLRLLCRNHNLQQSKKIMGLKPSS